MPIKKKNASSKKIDIKFQVQDLKKQLKDKSKACEIFFKISKNTQGVIFQFVKDKNNTYSFTYISGQVIDKLNIPQETILKDPSILFRYIPKNNLDSFLAKIEQSAQSLERWEDEFQIIKDGKEFWFRGCSQPEKMVNGNIVWTGTAYEITEKKIIEQELIESHDRFKVLHNASFGGIAIHDKGVIIETNKGLSEMTGFSFNELLGMDGLNLIAPEYRKLVMKNIELQFENNYFAVGLKKDGSCYPLEICGKEILYKGKKVRVTEFRDITKAKNDELALNKANILIHSILDFMPSVVVGIDLKKKITLWNAEAKKVALIPEKKAVNSKLFDICPDLKIYNSLIDKAFKQGSVQKKLKSNISIFGQTIYADTTIYPLKDKKRVTGGVIRIDNVSERVKMEENLIQSEKMISIGSMAAGLAHEINNPLAGIVQSVQVIKNRLNKDSSKNINLAEKLALDLPKMLRFIEKRKIFNLLDYIFQSSNRASVIIKNMLSFSRKSKSRLELHSIQDVMDQTINLLRSDYSMQNKYSIQKIKFTKKYSPNLPDVLCEPNEIQQVFFNILKNGAIAMLEKRKKNYKPEFKILITNKKNKFLIEITDSGPGIAKKYQKQIFEPFFTTKSSGEGTGLGLAISNYIITKNHKGTITVNSTETKGATFLITLPC